MSQVVRPSGSLWHSVRGLPDFWRLLELRVASQFGDGLFQAGLAGGLLFNPERAADPWAIAGAFAAMPDIRYEVVHSSFGPGLVVLELLVTGTLADGGPARFHACDVMTVRDGKVAAKRSYRKVAG